MTADQRLGLDRRVSRRTVIRFGLLGVAVLGLNVLSGSRAEANNCPERWECLKEYQAGFVFTSNVYENNNSKPGFQTEEGDKDLGPAVGQKYLIYNKRNPKQYTIVEIGSDGIARDSKGCDVLVFAGGEDSKIRVSNGTDASALTVVVRRINAYDTGLKEIVRLGDENFYNSALGCNAKLWNLNINEQNLVRPTPLPTVELIPTPTVTPTPAPNPAPQTTRDSHPNRSIVNQPIPEGDPSLGSVYGLVPIRDIPWNQDPRIAA